MEKKKKILLGIAGVLVVGAGAYYFYDKKKKAEAILPSMLPSSTPEAIPLPAAPGNTGIYNPIQIQQQTQAALQTSSLPSVEALASKTWQVNDKQYPGTELNIRYTTDGGVLIGSGYKGTLVGNSIVTKERNGAPDPIKTWTPLNGVGSLRGLGSYNMNF